MCNSMIYRFVDAKCAFLAVQVFRFTDRSGEHMKSTCPHIIILFVVC